MSAKNDTKSLIMLIVSTLIFGTIGIFRRYIPISSAMLACFRGFSGALFLFLFVLITKRKIRHNIGIKNILMLVVVGAAIGFNWILLFEAYNYTSVATATLCYYMEPTIVLLASPIFFKEKLTLKKIICALIAIVGMIFVSGILDSGAGMGTNIKGVFCGLGAALLYSSVVIMNKKLAGVDVYEKTVVELFSAAAVLIPYLLITEDFGSISLDIKAVVMMFVVGLIHTGLAYALYFGSIDGLLTQTVAIFSYIDPVTALILSALILHEGLSVLGLVGAVMILSAAFFGETG